MPAKVSNAQDTEKGKAMNCAFPDLPGWTFEIHKVSSGVFKVVAKDEAGERFSRAGTDVKLLTSYCKRDVENAIDKERAQGAK